jgi:DNA modification methylase
MTQTALYTGDCIEVLKRLPAESVQCVVTSPPYYGLRDYGHAGQIGLEQTPDDYVAKMVEVFREVRRVLRDDGTVWLNIGDSYAGSNKGTMADGSVVGGPKQRTNQGTMLGAIPKTAKIEGCKPKDLIGIPWMLAFALRADGWYLRQDIIWHKPNPMPESVADRCTKAHEYVFLLSKSPRYYFDAEAVKESAVGGDEKRNRRSVWTIPTRPFKEAHFAVMPEALVEPCVLAGTSEKGCCAACGAPNKRVTGRPCAQCSALIPTQGKECSACGHRNTEWQAERESNPATRAGESETAGPLVARKTDLTPKSIVAGWEPSCACGAETAPCVVLDPFTGSGTVAVVAERHGRSFVGAELNPEYAQIAWGRIAGARIANALNETVDRAVVH